MKRVFSEKKFEENAQTMRRKCTQKCIDKARALKNAGTVDITE